MEISLVIPYYQSDDEKPHILAGAIESMAGQFTELIVVADMIDNLAVKINKGLALATCPYIVVTNDDVVLTRGELKDLCKYNKVVTPHINDGTVKTFHGHAWGMPRWVYEKIGGMDENYTLYWMDTDYAMRLREAEIEVEHTPDVNMKHPEGARTLKHWAGRTEWNDKEIFVKKWGGEVYDPFRS